MANNNLREVLKKLTQKTLNWVKSNCVNNLLSTATNLPLAAAQGKVLDEKIGEVTQSLSNISKRATTIKGYINEYNDDTHAVGISHKNQKSTAVPSIVIDGKYYDLLLNNVHSDTNYKIVDTEVVIESGVWKLKITVYIDGVYYYKYLNFDK